MTMIKCAECGTPTEEEDLIYNDEIGSDVCADCNAAAEETEVEDETEDDE